MKKVCQIYKFLYHLCVRFDVFSRYGH